MNIDECDFWVVYGDMIDAEVAICAPENTLFVTYEPSIIHRYRKGFLDQFQYVVGGQEYIDHPGLIRHAQCQHWWAGIRQPGLEVVAGYDEFASPRFSTQEKTKTLSLLHSDKTWTADHRRRLEFVRALKVHFGDRLDIFGRGINPVADKLEAVLPYKYTIVLENTMEAHYWSEKLADAYIGGAFPFYYGCPNLSDYFSENAFVRIGFENAIDIIENALAEDFYSTRFNDMRLARTQVLNDYNLFSFLSKIIEKRLCHRFARKKRLLIRDDGFYINRNAIESRLRDVRTLIRMISKKNQPTRKRISRVS